VHASASPLVTLWKLLCQVQRTVSPTAMVIELGENVKSPPGPHYIENWTVADGNALRASRRLIINGNSHCFARETCLAHTNSTWASATAIIASSTPPRPLPRTPS
jgi:hypothetical protein